MNETNRMLIVLASSAWIVVMAALIFVTWASPDRAILRLEDFVEFLDDNNTNAGKLIVTLGAAATAVLALLLIILEFGPEDEPKELRVEQAGATTIIPAEALRGRLEEALLTLPEVTGARTRVHAKDQAIAASVDLTVTRGANVGDLTQRAVRVVVDTVHTDLGLAVAGMPDVKFSFTDGPAPALQSAPQTPAAAVHFNQPSENDPAAGHADSSPGPLIYDESSPPDENQSP
jgi:hypothetical protein